MYLQQSSRPEFFLPEKNSAERERGTGKNPGTKNKGGNASIFQDLRLGAS